MILVTGATGFVGKALVERINAQDGMFVRAVFRSEVGALPDDVETVCIGDLNATNNWREALSDVDVIIHAAARVHVMDDTANDPLTEFRKVNLEGTLNLARQAVQAGVKRFIFISSIKVNGEETVLGKPFTADDAPDPVDPYGVSKAETEQALLEIASSTGLEVVIIRPVLVYGPGVKANFQSLMKWIYKGVPLPLGAVYNQRSLVALENLVSFIIHCIDHPKAANEIFLISDGKDVSTTELLQKVATAFGKRPFLIPVPVSLMKFAANTLGKGDVANRLFGSLQVNSSKAQKLLGWKPVISMDEQLKKIAKLEKRH